jgi:serine/threonine-protein kinase
MSRYAEATTAANTFKFGGSPQYFAPERWRNERATAATDVFSLGVIAFQLVEHRLPFPGPGVEDFQDQILKHDAPELTGVPASLGAVVAECLYKAPGARPTAAELLKRFAIIRAPSSEGIKNLDKIHESEVAKRSEKERAVSDQRSRAEGRDELWRAAEASWKKIRDEVHAALLRSVHSASCAYGRLEGRSLGLQSGQIDLGSAERTPVDPWQGKPAPFDVIAHAGFLVAVSDDGWTLEGRSHSFWFCDAFEEGRYQWFETAFMTLRPPPPPSAEEMLPFHLDPGPEAAQAFLPSSTDFRLAWPLQPVTIGELGELIGRWAGWFASACDNRVPRPAKIPEIETPRNWRRA